MTVVAAVVGAFDIGTQRGAGVGSRNPAPVQGTADELDGGLGLALAGGRALGAGFARDGDGNFRFAAVRLTTALIFSDGFESAGRSYWSAAVP